MVDPHCDVRITGLVKNKCKILRAAPENEEEQPFVNTSNGGCRREEKSRKRWSLFTKFLFSVTANLSIC